MFVTYPEILEGENDFGCPMSGFSDMRQNQSRSQTQKTGTPTGAGCPILCAALSRIGWETNIAQSPNLVIPTGGTRFCVPERRDLRFLSCGNETHLSKYAMNFGDTSALNSLLDSICKIIWRNVRHQTGAGCPILCAVLSRIGWETTSLPPGSQHLNRKCDGANQGEVIRNEL
jgi:hypothetical protein